jgi:Mg2+ and Co2+ transporter CorA
MAASVKVHTASNFINAHCENSSCPEIWGEVAADCSYIATSIEVYTSRFKAMIPVVTSLVQIVESRQSFAETRNLSRLTYLALVFVPLAYVSSLFSMSGETAPGGKFFWVYFAVSIPLLGAVFLLARPPKGIQLLLTYLSGHPREETKNVSIPG